MRLSRIWVLAAFSLVAWITTPLPSSVAAQNLPYTFFLTRYELGQSMDMSNMGRLERVRYHSDGQPFAKAPDGSSITMSGQGAWDPGSKRATGGGQYTVKDPSGAIKAQGAWRVTSFISFDKLSGWWNMPGLQEEGWQGPPGSTTFSGFLKLNVSLDNLGDGVLEVWCLMPGATKPGDHKSDGISLTGGPFNFSDYHEQEGARPPQGLMFYSTNPAEDGMVLASDGTTTYRAAGPGRLPSTGTYEDASATMRALGLAAIGLGLIAMGVALQRRST